MTVVTHGDDRPIWNMYQTMKHLLDHHIQEYDWFYLVQDDTYTEAHRISRLAAHLSIDADLYLGRPEEFIGGDTEGRYCYGGFGYLLSRSLLKKLQPHLESCRNDILSARPDEWLGRCIIDYTHVNCVDEHEVREAAQIHSAAYYRMSSTLCECALSFLRPPKWTSQLHVTYILCTHIPGYDKYSTQE